MTLVYVLLFAHFVADFMCQSDWMAVNKSKRWDALGIHVLVYGVVLGAFVLPVIANYGGHGPTIGDLAHWLLVNSAAHFVQDAITSRWTSKLWFLQRADGIWMQAPFMVPRHNDTIVNPWVARGGSRHYFFVVIGLDQLLHYVTLFVTAQWWLR